MKKLPGKLIERQQAERSATAEAVTNAVIELKSQGYDVRIKDIMFVTSLSRSVFAKPHIRRILIEYGIFKPKKLPMNGDIQTQNNCPKKCAAVLAEKNGYIDRLLLENERLKQECAVLRGRIYMLMCKKSLTDDNDF
jgi:hypothetical protein